MSVFPDHRQQQIKHLDKAELASARNHRLKELQMWSLVREMVIQMCFLALLCVSVYSNLNVHRYEQVDHLRKYFLSTQGINVDYTGVSDVFT